MAVMSYFDNDLDLPLEVIELIIDDVAEQGDKETLRSVALASPRFVDRCQKKLFQTIDLGDRCISGEEYFQRFLHILTVRPKFRSYVRTLRLVDSFVWDKNKRSIPWILTEDGVCDILDFLPNLQNFSLTFNTGQPSWTTFKPCVRRSLIQLARRPTILSFSLNRIQNFPPTLLLTLAAVKKLELDGLKVHDPFLTSAVGILLNLAFIPLPQLQYLGLKDPSSPTVHVLRSLLSLYPEPTLRKLCVAQLDEKDTQLIDELWGLLQWASTSLIGLEWRSKTRLRTPALRPPLPIDIGILSVLESLHFLVNFHSASQPVFSELLHLLSQISSGYRFRELIIECMFVKVMELVACGSDWSTLDLILSREEFSGLKSIVFCARLRSDSRLKHSAKTVLIEQLPAVRSRGVKFAFEMDFKY